MDKPKGERVTLRIPTTDGALHDYVKKEQERMAETYGRAMSGIKAMEDLRLEESHRKAEAHAATVETPDELRRLNGRVDDLTKGQERTHRWVVATAILTAVIVLLTIALVILTVVLLNHE
jgi:hypothetical protein